MVEEFDFSRLRRTHLSERPSLFSVEQSARPTALTAGVLSFLKSLPRVGMINDIRALARATVEAKRRGRMILFMFGAHLIKCGLTPILIDLMKQGFIKALATHGASCVHDIELALCGRTSEDVAAALKDGSFGMADETGKVFAKAAEEGAGKGLGAALGEVLLEAPLAGNSLFAAAAQLSIPVTVHIAIGTDIVHTHPALNGAKLGAATLSDFRRFVNIVAQLHNGVVINFGSAVIMPEVFLKALSAARNAFNKPYNFHAANFDQIPHYRPTRNILERTGAISYNINGRHEITLPLLRLFLLAEERGWKV